MINIKLSTDNPDWPYLRQTPESKGVWDTCQFWVNSNIDECDWWFVYEGLVQPETTRCDPNHVVLITGEPPVTRTYDPKFLAQFSSVITSHTDLAHSRTLLMQQALPWYVGVDKNTSKANNTFLDYDNLKSMTVGSLNKSKLVSVISSSKEYTKGHRNRIYFVKHLLNRFGDQVDFYGQGFFAIEDKWEAIAPYKYHIVLENSSVPHYFTEKLSDAFLGWSYPIYYGCPNIFDYFPRHSLAEINILDLDQVVDTIEKVIDTDTFEERMPDIERARNLVLDRYNLFALVAEYSKAILGKEKTQVNLYPESYNMNLASRVKKMYRKVKHYGFEKMSKIFLEQHLYS
jgi:hypothetical protein